MAVRIIKATKQITKPEQKKLRVCAYARVSTDDQESSYEAQVEHYTNYIQKHPDMEFVGMYADEGISGTQTKNRKELNRMIEDCEKGLIEKVLCKSISRLARNTVDSLNVIRKLKALRISIFFEKENIDTLDASGEILITILSSLAQQESQSISQNVRMGFQYRMQEGKGFLNTDKFLGLTKGDTKYDYVIVPEEAETVRRIYREFLDGYSPAMIARHLERDGILTPAKREKWCPATVLSILSNEKYCGDMLLQKTFVEDYLTHKTVKNTGQLPQYFVEDHHDPIVPKEVYFQVQGEIMRRKKVKDPTKVRKAEENPLIRRVYCGKCGAMYNRCTTETGIFWRNRKRKDCKCKSAKEEAIVKAVEEAFGKIDREELIRNQDEIRMKLVRLDTMIECKEGEEKDSLILDRAETANQEMQIRLLMELVDGQGREESADPACREYEEFFRRTRKEVTDMDEKILRYVEKVTVWDEKIDVELKGNVKNTAEKAD